MIITIITIFGLNRPLSYYSTEESGSRDIFMHFIREVDGVALELYQYCAHSKILQNVMKYRSINILIGIAKRSILFVLLLILPTSGRR